MRKLFIAIIALSIVSNTSKAQDDQVVLKQLCIIQSNSIRENSGIGVSGIYPDSIWMHNDSGSAPIAFLVSTRTGQTLARVTVDGAINRDWEDMDAFTINGKSYLVMADVGDNNRKRTEYQLCIFPEPELEITDHEEPTVIEQRLIEWKDLRFQYEDGPRNCEAVAFDTEQRQFILVEKVATDSKQRPGVYQIDLPEEKADQPLVARRIAELRLRNITAMDISSDGKTMLVRTYISGFLFRRTADQTWAEALADQTPDKLGLPIQRQGEGICFNADETGMICSSELIKAPLWQVLFRQEPERDN